MINLKNLMEPDSIAVVGASEKSGPGRQVIENLNQLGYKGKIFPVNPKYSEVLGYKCYASISSIYADGESVELAALVMNKDWIISTLEEAGKLGVSSAWAFATGFGEAGTKGKERQNQLVEICKKFNMSFCGPNCVGFLNFDKSVGAYSAPAPRIIQRGNIGVVSQSGYLSITMANSHRGLGFSAICSTGNEAVVDSTDYISYLLENESTAVVMAFMEQFRNPDRLIPVAQKAVELGKPIVVIKVGKSSLAQRATVAHTGALAGTDDVQDAVFKKNGIIRVSDLDEMYETALLFSRLKDPYPTETGIFALTTSGGVIGLIADIGENFDLQFPEWSEEGKKNISQHLPEYASLENPLDAWGFGRLEENYYPCLRAAGRETSCGILLISQDIPPGMAENQKNQFMIVAEAAVKAKNELGKTVIFISNPSTGFDPEIRKYLEDNGVPLLQGTRAGLVAVNNLINYIKFRAEEPAVVSKNHQHKATELFDTVNVFTEYTSKKVLAEYGLTCTPEALCGSPEEAIEYAHEIGYPVALKVMSPQILHKTEANIVTLNVKNDHELLRAYKIILENSRHFDSVAEIDGVLCQKMVNSPVAEMMLGVNNDPQYGPAVVVGLGGVMVEILKDATIGIPPLRPSDAQRMIDGSKAKGLLYGFRGNKPGDIEALKDAIVKIGQLACDWKGKIEAIDLNPIMVMPKGQGIIVADALITTLNKEKS